MKKLLIMILIILVTGCSVVPQTVDPATLGKAFEPETSEPSTWANYYKYVNEHPIDGQFQEGLHNFSIASAYQLLSGEDNQNFSPISLYYVMAMVAVGSDGETAEEIYRVLDREKEPELLAQDMNTLYQYLNLQTEHSQMKLANSIWNKQDYPFHQSYIDRLNGEFQASLFEVDFTDPNTAKWMSQWVSDQTNGLIKPTFDDTDNLVSVLFNTLYFKQNWSKPFDSAYTINEVFHGTQGDVNKEFLRSNDTAGYINQDGVEGIILPFENARMIILKSPGNNPREILSNYNYPTLAEQATRAIVDLKLPKFMFENSFDLIPSLKSLGINHLFEPGEADLSAMTPNSVYISTVRQDSYISLDEKGVEAAAMTMGAATESVELEPPRVTLTFDEPFLYIIESYGGLPLFIGTVTQ